MPKIRMLRLPDLEHAKNSSLRACNKTHSKAAAAPASYCCWRTFIWLMCSFLMRCGI